VLWAGGVPIFGIGAFDVYLLWVNADIQRRTVNATTIGAVSETSALWVSANRGVAASGRLAIDEHAVKREALDDLDLKPLWDGMGGSLWKKE
jgi:hypothetical protein